MSEAICHDPKMTFTLVETFKILGKFIERLQEQQQKIFTQIMTAPDAHAVTVVPSTNLVGMPTNKRIGKRPMTSQDASEPCKIPRIQRPRVGSVLGSQSPILPKTIALPTRMQCKYHKCSGHGHFVCKCTLPRVLGPLSLLVLPDICRIYNRPRYMARPCSQPPGHPPAL
ncbi:hypothetical protein NE237_019514 [Protea cynaroides]|uniref:Uncharacterized protein n=1 Tax=Protea cynaroides TaxID=273540 RepID=A0A9Q0GK78_9MAGN|nr:hypothetical protein NE237_019514 [Protea cynaroides]